jgi:hypothetical protein
VGQKSSKVVARQKLPLNHKRRLNYQSIKKIYERERQFFSMQSQYLAFQTHRLERFWICKFDKRVDILLS